MLEGIEKSLVLGWVLHKHVSSFCSIVSRVFLRIHIRSQLKGMEEVGGVRYCPQLLLGGRVQLVLLGDVWVYDPDVLAEIENGVVGLVGVLKVEPGPVYLYRVFISRVEGGCHSRRVIKQFLHHPGTDQIIPQNLEQVSPLHVEYGSRVVLHSRVECLLDRGG